MRKRNKNFTFKMTLKPDRCPEGYLSYLRTVFISSNFKNPLKTTIYYFKERIFNVLNFKSKHLKMTI